MNRDILLIIVFSCLSATNCSEKKLSELQSEISYQLVKTIEIKHSNRAWVSAYGTKNSVILDFNQQPGDSLHGVQVYNKIGDMLWQNFHYNYYVHNDLNEEKFILSHFTPGGNEPNDRGFPGEYTHQVFDSSGKIISEGLNMPGIAVVHSNDFEYFGLERNAIHVVSSNLSEEIKIPKKQIRADKFQINFINKDSVIVIGGRSESYYENDKDIEKQRLLHDLQSQRNALLEEHSEFQILLNNEGVDSSLIMNKMLEIRENDHELVDQMRSIRSGLPQNEIKRKYFIEAYIYSTDSKSIIDTLLFENDNPWFRTVDYGYSNMIKVNKDSGTIGYLYSTISSDNQTLNPRSGLLVFTSFGKILLEYTDHSVFDFKFVEGGLILIQFYDDQQMWLQLMDIEKNSTKWTAELAHRNNLNFLGNNSKKLAFSYKVSNTESSTPYLLDLNNGMITRDTSFIGNEELITNYFSDNRVTFDRASGKLRFYQIVQ